MAFGGTLHTHTHTHTCAGSTPLEPARRSTRGEPAIWARAGWDGGVAGRVGGCRAGGGGPGGDLEKGCSGLEKSFHHMENMNSYYESICGFSAMKNMVKSWLNSYKWIYI